MEHGIDAAIECGIRVKINVVLTPQTDVVALTRYASKKGTDIRFIEMMPVGEGHTNGVEPYEKVIGALLKVYGTPCHIDTEIEKKLIRDIIMRITVRQSITVFVDLISE